MNGPDGSDTGEENHAALHGKPPPDDGTDMEEVKPPERLPSGTFETEAASLLDFTRWLEQKYAELHGGTSLSQLQNHFGVTTTKEGRHSPPSAREAETPPRRRTHR